MPVVMDREEEAWKRRLFIVTKKANGVCLQAQKAQEHGCLAMDAARRCLEVPVTEKMLSDDGSC